MKSGGVFSILVSFGANENQLIGNRPVYGAELSSSLSRHQSTASQGPLPLILCVCVCEQLEAHRI